MSTLMAASRDASWYDCPDTTTVKVMHVARVYELDDTVWSARCNRRTPLDETVSRPAEEVPAGLRCQRRGCRELWPAEAARS